MDPSSNSSNLENDKPDISEPSKQFLSQFENAVNEKIGEIYERSKSEKALLEFASNLEEFIQRALVGVPEETKLKEELEQFKKKWDVKKIDSEFLKDIIVNRAHKEELQKKVAEVQLQNKELTEKYNKLKVKLAQSQGEVEDLHAKNTNLEETFCKKNQEILKALSKDHGKEKEELNETISNLKKETINLQKKADKEAEEAGIIKTRLVEAQNILTIKEKENSLLSQQVKDYYIQNELLQNQISEKNNEVDNIKKEAEKKVLDQYELAHIEIDRFKNEKSTLEYKIAHLFNNNQILEQQLRGIQNEDRVNKSQLNEQNLELNKLKAQLMVKDDMIKDFQRNLKQSEDKNDLLQRKIEQLKFEIENKRFNTQEYFNAMEKATEKCNKLEKEILYWKSQEKPASKPKIAGIFWFISGFILAFSILIGLWYLNPQKQRYDDFVSFTNRDKIGKM